MFGNVPIKSTLDFPLHNGSERGTFHIHIQGLVQGVGFRPFVYKMAKKELLKGWVNNTTDGVHIEFNADEETAKLFYKSLIRQAPALSKITSHSMVKTTPQNFNSFEIIESKASNKARLMLTPDFAMCVNCKKELYDPKNVRFNYPFITCTHCGPRYSIINSLPYDRSNTSMKNFEMCGTCSQEYNNPENSRHFSQTNSCSACGIKMEMFDKNGNSIAEFENLLQKIIIGLEEGKIIAVKGIGGFLLLCDAENSNAIKTLRERKHRPAKPFAMMFPNIHSIKKIALLNQDEEDALQDHVSPIVLVEINKNTATKIQLNEIAPYCSPIGAMIPYAPLFELILSAFGKPVVATSANISDAPIVFNDEAALRSLFLIADFIVTNNREIILPQDDSVIRFSKKTNQRIIFRRSRGMAPSYFNYCCNTDETILATGALLKSSFTFVNNKNTYVSQYLGSTESYEAQETYSKTVQHFFDLFNRTPGIILTDKHPGYFSNHFATSLGEQFRVPVKTIQHHKAHFAAVLAENKLLHQRSNLSNAAIVLGVIWDGTGLGDDGNIWGGEFFKYENNHITRVEHFEYFPFILGDKMPKEPRISALSTCAEVQAAEKFLINKFSENEWKIYRQMLKKNSLKCSSVGRVFDAVASLLSLCDKQSFEGEAAMLLQHQAFLYFEKNNWKMPEYYFIKYRNKVSTSSLMHQIVLDLQLNKPVSFIAAKFHFSLVKLVELCAKDAGLKKIAFSGGVFLNSVLADLLNMHLSKDFELFFHKELSPNDENISFGQLVYYDNKIDEENVNSHLEQDRFLKKIEQEVEN